MHDLVIRGGRVIDTAQGWDGPLDVAIDGHRIAAVGTDLSADGVRQVLDATGLIVTPGLVDLHTHAYWGVPPPGIEPDPHLLRRGPPGARAGPGPGDDQLRSARVQRGRPGLRSGDHGEQVPPSGPVARGRAGPDHRRAGARGRRPRARGDAGPGRRGGRHAAAPGRGRGPVP